VTYRQIAGIRHAESDNDSTFFMTLDYLLGSTAAHRPNFLLNVDQAALALQGYDPVAFFADGKPVRGNPVIQTDYRGARYQFVSQANKAIFDRKPARFEPQFGGYCAFGVTRGQLVTIAVEAFQVINGRLLLLSGETARDDFNKNPTQNLFLADEKWPWLVSTQGRARREAS
jgi:YHS domain-containing protein